jgi:hypothetical protein
MHKLDGICVMAAMGVLASCGSGSETPDDSIPGSPSSPIVAPAPTGAAVDPSPMEPSGDGVDDPTQNPGDPTSSPDAAGPLAPAPTTAATTPEPGAEAAPSDTAQPTDAEPTDTEPTEPVAVDPSDPTDPSDPIDPSVTPEAPAVCGEDTCPMSSGLSFACAQRFALGVNYAWHDFGADFGGLEQWGMGGVTAQQGVINDELAEMKANGVSVVRWWMFPDFRGDGVQFDAEGNPSGLSATAVEDVKTALALAEANDLYLVFTLLSFDNFRPTRTDSGVEVRGITPLVTDPARRALLIQNVVKPAAQAAAASPNSNRLLGWDVINEPEWAIAPSGENDQDFTPNEELDAVPLADMKALINESLDVLEVETPNALRSVGWAAAKWAWAFSDVTNVDFHQPHIYGWVDMYWPYTQTPAELGYGDKPTVMGEFYLLDMPFSDSGNDVSFATLVDSWYSNGYAGAWAWAYSDETAGPANLPLIRAFADTQDCSVSF